MKVVINKCFGGFGLSPLAMVELIKAGSPIIERCDAKEYYGGNNPNFQHRDWQKAYDEDLARNKEEVEGYSYGLLATLYKDGFVYNYKRDDGLRSDPALIEVVERLGEAANGHCAKLRIVDVPDDVEFEISEYDGLEHIAEVHRTWG